MGGYILSKSLSVLYVFAGPVHGGSALDIEIEACKHLWLVFRDLKANFKSIICTNSKNIEEMVIKAKAGLKDSRQEFDKIENFVASFPSCDIKYINRIGTRMLIY